MALIQINIFLIHYTKLKKREPVFASIQNVLNSMLRKNTDIRVSMKTVSKFDPESLDPEFMKRIFDSNPIADDEFFSKFVFKSTSPNVLSNALKHMDALNYIYKNTSDTDINIVIEDDVMFDGSFEDNLLKFIRNELYKNADIIFFGLPSSTLDNNQTELQVIDVTDKKSILPCCDSYFISKKTAECFAKNFIPIRFPNNIHLSYLINKYDLKLQKLYPNILADGSKIGSHPSTISPNNILIFNGIYKQIYKLLEKPVPTVDDINTIETLLTNNKFKESPDFIFLEGLFFLRTKQYSKAKTLFDKALVSYEENCSPLSNQSALIQNYIDLCKHTQEDQPSP